MIIHVFLLILFRLAINVCAYFLTCNQGSNQLLRMAWLLGFEGGEAEWDKEYVVLCRSYNWILGIRWAPTMDGAPLSGATSQLPVSNYITAEDHGTVLGPMDVKLNRFFFFFSKSFRCQNTFLTTIHTRPAWSVSFIAFRRLALWDGEILAKQSPKWNLSDLQTIL